MTGFATQIVILFCQIMTLVTQLSRRFVSNKPVHCEGNSPAL
jgi:hypothetical protein